MTYFTDNDEVVTVTPYMSLDAQPNAHVTAYRLAQVKAAMGTRYILHPVHKLDFVKRAPANVSQIKRAKK